MSDAGHEHPQPGWYADPATNHGARWWDGSAWTVHVRELPGQGGAGTGGRPSHVEPVDRLDRWVVRATAIVLGLVEALSVLGLLVGWRL